ncbi:MAG: tryptophanase [Desulfurococcales archaeon]|nr:tryptophanase [Desulfurococcales archaeon]
MDLPIEYYRIKMVERIRLPSREERYQNIVNAGWNVFRLRSRDVFIDLLTDSGTGSMSKEQWAALMMGDESYAGADSWYRFKESVKDVLGFDYVLPVHQGRAAERILYTTLLDLKKPADTVPANTHFDTGKAVIEYYGAKPLDLPVPQALDYKSEHPFKGDIDLARLEEILGTGRVAFVLLVLTNNTMGGHPVSPENIRETKKLAEDYGVPLVLDISRFAENAFLIKERHPNYRDKSIPEIVKETMSHADHVIMSAKKDGLANIGGFIATRSEDLYNRLTARVVLEEGFITYGGLAGRDLDAIAAGLREVVDEDYLRSRVSQVAYLHKRLLEEGVPVVSPPGGHAVYIDALEMLPHIKRENFPADALAAHLYLESGVRGVGLGALAFARETDSGIVYPENEFLRLAVPRRVYTVSHLEYVAESLGKIAREPEKVKGLRIVWEPPIKGIRHFLARLEPVS